MTLTFDFLTQKSNQLVFIPKCTKIANLVVRTHRRTKGRTGRQPENIVPPALKPLSVVRHKTSTGLWRLWTNGLSFVMSSAFFLGDSDNFIVSFSSFSRAVIRAALAAFLSCPLLYAVCTLLCCWVNKERKKERKKEVASFWYCTVQLTRWFGFLALRTQHSDAKVKMSPRVE